MPTLRYSDYLSLPLSLFSSLPFCPAYSMLRSNGVLSLYLSLSLFTQHECRIHRYILYRRVRLPSHPLRHAHHLVRYSAYMIRCNYNQVNNCYDRYRRALCANGWPGEPVTNAARFVRRPAPITLSAKGRKKGGHRLPYVCNSGYRIFGHSDYAAHDSAID